MGDVLSLIERAEEAIDDQETGGIRSHDQASAPDPMSEAHKRDAGHLRGFDKN